ncbi:M15 family metallopeptidase [Paenibacillus sp.]|nr:M15 family metallopeptidase [Paenibacillus sp.]
MVRVAEERKKHGFEWGGDWSGFKDCPHFQMTSGLWCNQLT